MSLIWIRTPAEIIVGEVGDLSSVIKLEKVQNPMILTHVQMKNPSPLHGQKPQMVLGFHLNPIPCGEIIVKEVSYAGAVNTNDPVYTTYYKILEAVREQQQSPLMVPQ